MVYTPRVYMIEVYYIVTESIHVFYFLFFNNAVVYKAPLVLGKGSKFF